MKTLQIDELKAKELYKNSSDEFKCILEDTFGKEYLTSPTKITDRVKSYEDACKILDIAIVSDVHLLGFGFTDDEIAYRKIKTIITVLNEGWVPDWSNSKECKYYPYFKMNDNVSSGFGFSFSLYAYLSSASTVGSRLCFRNRELAEYAGKQFLEIYKNFMLC